MNGLTPAEAAQLGIAITIALCGGATILWGLWHAFWMIFDHCMQHLTRKRNRRHIEISPRQV